MRISPFALRALPLRCRCGGGDCASGSLVGMACAAWHGRLCPACPPPFQFQTSPASGVRTARGAGTPPPCRLVSTPPPYRTWAAAATRQRGLAMDGHGPHVHGPATQRNGAGLPSAGSPEARCRGAAALAAVRVRASGSGISGVEGSRVSPSRPRHWALGPEQIFDFCESSIHFIY